MLLLLLLNGWRQACCFSINSALCNPDVTCRFSRPHPLLLLPGHYC
jgi:hypothetical protein